MGFILLDTSFRVMYATEQAMAILAYPRVPFPNKGFENFLQSRIRSLLPSNGGHNGLWPSKFPNEVASGKRRYEVRAFSVKSNLKNGLRPAVALLLERNHRGLLDLQTVARKLRMTPRETETVGFLVQGLGTKQIASRMGISPNTVKVFLRSVMFKVGAEYRHGIIGKILQASKAINEGSYR